MPHISWQSRIQENSTFEAKPTRSYRVSLTPQRLEWFDSARS